MNRKGIKDFWSAVLKEMAMDAKATPETAFKKISSENPALSFSVLDLPVYRWCMLALHTSVSHHLLPLVFQNFFVYYLQRVGISGSSQKCIGYRFFKSGPFNAAIKKLACKLKESGEFYQKAIDSASCEKVSNNSPNEAEDSKLKGQKNYLSISVAFLRWIEDGDLSGPVDFRALNPEYLPERLKIILDFNQKPWFDFMNLDAVKEEVMPKSGLWKCVNDSRSSSMIEVASEPDVSLSDVKSEKKLEGKPLSVLTLEQLDSFLQELGSVDLSSWSELRKVIKSDQKALSDEAKQFQENIEKFEDLNKRYENLVRKLYKIKPSHVKHSKPCHMGSRCTGPAKFSVTVNKVFLDTIAHDEVESNETRFRTMIDELCKPCYRKLCLAAVHAEICVSKLVQRLKVTGPEASKEWCKMGISLFYDQLLHAESIFQLGNEFAREYPPVKQFFSTCLEVLGRELIAGNEDQLLPLVKVILSHSAIAGLASPFFCPENASSKMYVSVYNAVVKSVPSSSACAVFAILSKLKLRTYMESKNVSLLARRELIQHVCTGLAGCGSHPQGDILYVYEGFKKHLCTLLTHEFPDLYNDVIDILVSGTECGTINADVWYAVLQSLGCPFDTENYDFEKVSCEVKKFARNRVLSVDQKLYVSSPDLHLTQVVYTLERFAEFFGEARKIHDEQMYMKYKNYVDPISIMLGLMGCSLLDVSYGSHITSLGSKTKTVWELLHSAFKPWIDPVTKGEVYAFPWSPDERVEARKMFRMFAVCIEFLHTDFKDEVYGNSILSCTWNYYFDTYIEPGIRSYHFVVCHSALSGVPWEQFHPSHDDINKMCQVLKCQIPECRKFFLGLFFSIPWLEVMDGLLCSNSAYLVSCYLGCMAKLVIKFSWECPAGKKSSMQKILRKLEEMPWMSLSLENAEEIIDVYCRLCDPMNLLLKDDKPDVFVLRFLKVVCGMMPASEIATKFEVNKQILKRKRIMLLRKLVAMICKTINIDNGFPNNCEQCASLFPPMLGEIDFIVSKDFYPTEQVPAAMPLARIVLVSLNVIEDVKSNAKVLGALLNWLSNNAKSLLLLPCIKASCQSLYDVSSVIAIIECCMVARYSADLKSTSEAEEIWNLVSACIHLPESASDEVFASCIDQNAFLVLYEHIYRKISSYSIAENRINLLNKIIGDLKGKKPSENAETKILLVWDKILELSLSSAAEGNMPTVRELLVLLCDDLSMLAEDKEKGGFLSTLGLGKGSSYSVNFRFICRAISAYVLSQIPENGDIRLERNSPGYMVLKSPESETRTIKSNARQIPSPLPSKTACGAVDELQSLVTKKPYSALAVHVQRTLKCIYNPSYCLTDCRQLLKELSLQVFPDKSYLYLLNL